MTVLDVIREQVRLETEMDLLLKNQDVARYAALRDERARLAQTMLDVVNEDAMERIASRPLPPRAKAW